MDGRIDVVLDDSLADQNGVLIVVAPPGHEGHHYIPSQSQFPTVGGGTIRNDLPFIDLLPFGDNGLLIETGILVRSLILDQVVDIYPGIQPFLFGGIAFNDDPRRIHTLHHAGPPGYHHRSGVPRHDGFHPRTHQRRLRLHQRHRLPLHIGSHQGTVGIVVLKERNQSGCDTHQLIGRNIHHVDIRRYDG
ncbi:MAG: hypothetical protein ACD_87C00215G0001 [uncultured bacterium]|nr:MAG: hypothetical protein ACD_87C00215G0001 [uncultured bacterium]